MAVAIPQSPSVSFSVPTIGALIVPANLAATPPLEPMRTATQIGSLNDTGSGGERPQPPYPVIAKESGEQGAVVVLLGGDAAGKCRLRGREGIIRFSPCSIARRWIF